MVYDKIYIKINHRYIQSVGHILKYIITYVHHCNELHGMLMRDSYFYIKAFVAGYKVIVTDVVNSTIYTWVVLLEFININI